MKTKYPWAKIEPMKAIVIRSPSKKKVKSAINSAYSYGKAHGMKFTIKRQEILDAEENTTTYEVKILRLE